MNTVIEQSSSAVIKVEHLSKTFGKISAVDDLSFEVRQGEIFGFLGPNGAGKTTTLSIMEGLLRADRGQIYILGMDIKRQVKEIKRRIGVQLQSTSLLPDLTVFEQIKLFAQLYGFQPDGDEILSLLEQVGLTEKTYAVPGNLSGGQRQRLSLAIALINHPEIIFLDEPTTGLDPQSRRNLWDIVRELQNQGKTIVLTTHYMDEAETLCDRVGIIDRGKLIALDTPNALVNSLAGLSTITITENFPLVDLETLPEIKTIQRIGSQIHFQTENITKSVRTILDIAEQQNILINDLYIKQPNLEDVFLNLTGHTIRN